MSHRGTWGGQRLVETTGTNDASIFEPRGTNNIASAAGSGVALRGQTAADASAPSGDRTGEAGSATAAVDLTGTARTYIYVYAPDNMGTLNINAEANTVLTGTPFRVFFICSLLPCIESMLIRGRLFKALFDLSVGGAQI
jgi:hypothetical protein